MSEKARTFAGKASKELLFRQIVLLPECYGKAALVLRESSQSRAEGSATAGSDTESFIGRAHPSMARRRDNNSPSSGKKNAAFCAAPEKGGNQLLRR